MTAAIPLVSMVAATLAIPAGHAPPPEPGQPPIVVEVSDGGFHWLDAGIGGAAALAVVLLVVALALGVRQLGGKP